MAYLGRFPWEKGKKQAQKDLVELVHHGACGTSGLMSNVENTHKKCNGYFEEDFDSWYRPLAARWSKKQIAIRLVSTPHTTPG
jgi:hypothetical protein